MSFFKTRAVEKNYDMLSAYSWYTPSLKGLFILLGWFIIGAILGGIVFFLIHGWEMPYRMLIYYPVQFLPVLIYVKLKSSYNSHFDRGYSLDSNHFGKAGGLGAAAIVIAGTISLSFMTELINSILPAMDDNLLKTMEAMLSGPLWVSLLMTCVFAPVLEEWLCRGILLRGLLNYSKNQDELSSDSSSRGMQPALAIFISALFFAAIHGNLWQGITALIIGSFFGYVYYRTGSLKLTMLMHCTNNLLAVLMQPFGGEQAAEAKSMLELMPKAEYYCLFVVAAVILVLAIRYFSRIPLADPHGNCDVIPSSEDIAKAERQTGSSNASNV